MCRIQISASGSREISRAGDWRFPMNVEALDHVNIITDRLDETAEFYTRLLGLVR